MEKLRNGGLRPLMYWKNLPVSVFSQVTCGKFMFDENTFQFCDWNRNIQQMSWIQRIGLRNKMRYENVYCVWTQLRSTLLKKCFLDRLIGQINCESLWSDGEQSLWRMSTAPITTTESPQLHVRYEKIWRYDAAFVYASCSSLGKHNWAWKTTRAIGVRWVGRVLFYASHSNMVLMARTKAAFWSCKMNYVVK